MKKTLIIILIVVIVLGGFLYIRSKKTVSPSGGTTSGFKNFFNFGSKGGTPTQTPDNETSSEFTTENPDTTTASGTGGSSGTNTSIFGTGGPFTPSTEVNTVGSGTGVGGSGTTGGGTTGGGTGVGSGEGVGGGGTGGGSTGGGSGGSGGAVQCSADDTQIEFTPEEIARLQALEQRFYAIASLLHTDSDVQAETANYSSYKILNQKYTELIAYCENKSPLLATTTNRRVATPLYTDVSANTYFTDGPAADGVIDMQSSIPKLREIEQFLRISIW